MPTRLMSGVKYFITFIDDASCKVWAYPMARKSDDLHVFGKWLALVENQLGKKLQCYLWTDNGREYLSDEFQHVCDAHGIKRELTVPHNRAQNGVAKRMNHTIQEKIHNMLSHAALSYGFWAKALMTAMHLINRSPNHAIDCGIQEEIWNGKKPS